MGPFSGPTTSSLPGPTEIGTHGFFSWLCKVMRSTGCEPPCLATATRVEKPREAGLGRRAATLPVASPGAVVHNASRYAAFGHVQHGSAEVMTSKGTDPRSLIKCGHHRHHCRTWSWCSNRSSRRNGNSLTLFISRPKTRVVPVDGRPGIDCHFNRFRWFQPSASVTVF